MPLLDIGWPELVLILAILFFIFGGSRIKDVARGLGESVREFRKASAGQPTTVKKEYEEQAIIQAARKLGIKTEGKSVRQILEEMSETVEEPERKT